MGGSCSGARTHAPHRSPFVKPLFPLLVISVVTAHACCAFSPPARADILPFPSSANSSRRLPSLLHPSSSEFRRSAATEFFDTRVYIFFFLGKICTFYSRLYLIFESNFVEMIFVQCALYVSALVETFEFSVSWAIGSCIFTLESTFYVDKAAFSLSLPLSLNFGVLCRSLRSLKTFFKTQLTHSLA